VNEEIGIRRKNDIHVWMLRVSKQVETQR
jgi:hypothetical protein